MKSKLTLKDKSYIDGFQDGWLSATNNPATAGLAFDGMAPKPEGFCKLCGAGEDLYCSSCLAKDVDNYTASLRRDMFGAAEHLERVINYAQDLERQLVLIKKNGGQHEG